MHGRARAHTHKHACTQDKELRRLQQAHEVQVAAMHQELLRVTDLMAQNALLADRLNKSTAVLQEMKVCVVYVCVCMCACVCVCDFRGGCAGWRAGQNFESSPRLACVAQPPYHTS